MLFKLSAERIIISLLIFGPLKPTKTSRQGARRYVLPDPKKKPTNDEGKSKVLKNLKVKDRPNDNSPKISK